MSTLAVQFGLTLFDRARRGGSKSDARLAWEIMHWDALGLGDFIPDPDDDNPWPDPLGPLIEDNLSSQMAAVNSRVLAQLITARFEPEPQTNIPSPINDLQLRLDGALALQERLSVAMKSLDTTIAGIKKQIK
ncbi:hypothetical protein N9L47_02700 [Rhodobacteraceae bacterium]|nr:hypothetical protein [Paracoccaceae bacterium]